MATFASSLVWDIESFHAISARHVQLVRDAGAVAQLPLHLWQLALCSTWIGDFAGRGLARGRERERRGGDRQPHRAVHVVAAPGTARQRGRVLGVAGERDRARRGQGAGDIDEPALGGRRPVQRTWTLRGGGVGGPRSRLGHRHPEAGDVGPARARRGGRAQRRHRRSRAMRSSGSTDTTAAVRHRLRPRHRSALPGAAQRRCDGRGAVPRGDRAARAVHGSVRSSPAPTCSTESGCAARAGASTPASSCDEPTTCSPRSAWRRSPSAPAAS